jgi:hypothetical protein
VRAVDVLYNGPRPDVNDDRCRVRTCIRAHFARRFDDSCYTVNIFITRNLKDGLSVGKLFQGDDGDVLRIRLGEHGLENEDMNVLVLAGQDSDIVNVSVSVEVQIIHLAIRRIQQAFEFLRRRRLPEKFQCAFQAEIVPWHFSLIHLSRGDQSRRHHKYRAKEPF